MKTPATATRVNNPGNGNQGENPGNGNQGENPGNNGNQLGENPGNGNQGENPGGNGNQGENPRNSRRRTPDGSTPAEEATCDGLKHGTPGLYGLCIAFCEAHDCVPVLLDDDTLDFSHCKKNDGKLLQKYRNTECGTATPTCRASQVRAEAGGNRLAVR